MEDFEEELKEDFLNESVDLLTDAENAFLRLDSERGNQELINEIFRLAHNLKGTSNAVGFGQLAELTHVAENLILKLKEETLEVTDQVVTVLLEFKDKVNEIVEGLKGDKSATFDIDEIKNKLEAVTEGKGSIDNTEVSSPPLSDSTENTESDEVTPQGPEPLINPAALESLRESGFDESVINELKSGAPREKEESKEDSKDESAAPIKKSNPSTVARPAQQKESDESIRVRLSRIDKINNVIGELVILQTIASQRRYRYVQDDLMNKSIGMMGKLFKEVQEIAMSLRMLPLKGTFQKMNRIVRDTSRSLNKQVKLHMIGEDTEVDKTVLERLSDPLVHIVRNAIDHGLEVPEAREAAGKDPQGNVELMAFHEGSNLVIQVTDDGKGIDHEVIREKAIEKKVIEEHHNLTPQETIQLIFHPGFSTKESVSEISGRGVGMDVVKTNIEALGGEVKVMSKINEGSSFKIVLPLTLAIIEGIVIESSSDKYVIPLGQIFEIVQVKSSDVESFSKMASLFKLRGEVLPLFYLNSKLGNKIESKERNTAIIVRGGGHPFGVIVDDILHQQQIVIKKLGEDIRGKKGIMGSSIMADGRPSIILDLFETFKDDLKSSRGYKNFKTRKGLVA